MASSGENGPKGYIRLSIKDKVLTEVRDEDLITKEIDINQGKGFENTTVDVNKPGGDADFLWDQGHYPERWNLAKEVNLWIGNPTTSRGDWHKESVNKMCEVSPRIKLYTESIDNIQMKYSQEITDAQQPSPFGSIMSEVQKTVDSAHALGLGGSVGINRFSPYDTPQVFKGVTPLSMNGNLKFEFHFGQAGLFSGLEEVVKPIYAILSLFALGDKDTINSFADLPLPSQAQFTIQWLSSAFDSLKNADLVSNIKKAFKGGQEKTPIENGAAKTAGGIADSAAEVYNAYFNAVTAGGRAIFRNAKTKYNLAYVQVGNFTYGPMFVKDYSWGLDMSKIDEEGFPIYGWVELGGMKYVAKANRGQIAATLFSGVSM